jgi:hypothetical protein
MYGAGRAAEQAGDSVAAKAAYRAFLELLGAGDGERPEVSKAKTFLESTKRK